MVTIMLGTNDSKDRYWGSGDEAYGADAFAEQLTALINTYKALPSNPVVFIATSPTVYGELVDSINDPGVTEIVEIQKEVAAAEGCEIIDINAYTKNHQDWFGDGVHPNDNGYAQIATQFANAIAEVNEASLSAIQVGEMEIAVEDGVYEYTGYVPEGTEIPQVEAVNNYGATVTVEQAEDGTLPMSVTITVVSKKDHYRQVYTVNLEEGEIPDPVLKGDYDENGVVNIQDVMSTCRVVARSNAGTAPDAAELRTVDMTGDGNINVEDIMLICRVIAANNQVSA